MLGFPFCRWGVGVSQVVLSQQMGFWGKLFFVGLPREVLDFLNNGRSWLEKGLPGAGGGGGGGCREEEIEWRGLGGRMAKTWVSQRGEVKVGL